MVLSTIFRLWGRSLATLRMLETGVSHHDELVMALGLGDKHPAGRCHPQRRHQRNEACDC